MSDSIKGVVLAQADALVAQLMQCQKYAEQYTIYCIGVAGAAKDSGGIGTEIFMNVADFGDSLQQQYDMLVRAVTDLKESITLI